MNRILIALSCFVLLNTSLLSAEPEFPQAQEEHVWLKQFTGEWTSTSQSIGNPDQPSVECSGKMSSQMLGDFWVVNRMEGDANGETFQAIQTIGYDGSKNKYVGTWVDTMMNQLWHYEGTVDDSGKKLTLLAEGPSFFDPEKTAKYRDSYEFKSNDKIIATSEVMEEDGEWVMFMKGELQRNKTEK
ncbi:hypothetical protein Pla110_03130 [Polystyrenella longa]|uniref:DUF1579 domain-containing protein n=1 Tax=Polystyrenella longa TaxID=2528007 RepID=A0A518CHA2_9PLAN|nr:DUF1579 domain-containing protein [Polystyrenella longa]QDU78609.1 hypothetical protein Pla110_03130 [Polystyrenella longa]